MTQHLLHACSYESGDFFALDMGGTNFRTVYARLSGKPGETVMQDSNLVSSHTASVVTSVGLCFHGYLHTLYIVYPELAINV